MWDGIAVKWEACSKVRSCGISHLSTIPPHRRIFFVSHSGDSRRMLRKRGETIPAMVNLLAPEGNVENIF